MSMVMMFDELDKISATPKGEEVQNLLIHLTDSVQNSDFEDKYISGIPIDLSKIMFVFSANDLSKIDKVLLDRMIVIELKGYNSKDKAEIAKNFLVPNALKEVNLIDKVTFSKEIIDYILSNYCKEEPGVREFKRAIEQVVQKINMLRIFNSKDMPFYIENFSLPFVIEKKHIDLFLKRRTTSEDTSYLKMYI
jgi:ATP-dependent Lon protease